jgi:ADP-ribose pyrophosphatase YjhB (NUDIX family)
MGSEAESRRYPSRPLCGVGAILLSPDLREVLLVERGAPPSVGSWTFPGGLIEAGEPARAACARELAEETGLDGFTPGGLALVAERILRDAEGRAEYHYLILDFWGRAAERVAPRPGSDARAARWVPVDEVPRLATTRGVPEALRRALALARGEMPESPGFSE